MFYCDICNYETKTFSLLNEHTRALHEEVKVKLEGSLNTHGHIGQSPQDGDTYLCDKCDYQGTQMKNLTRHQKSRHQVCL